MLEHPVSGRFTSTHLCAIHRYLFGDLYAFAGQFRREDIMKGTTRFLGHRQIREKLQMLLKELRSDDFLRRFPAAAMFPRAAYYFAELNYIHPFREGNGRATREFMRQLFLLNGYSVNWSEVSVERFLRAMEESVYDTSELEDVLQSCLHPIEK